MNSYSSKMTDNYLNMMREMFHILDSITLMPQVLSIVWSNLVPDKITFSTDNIFMGYDSLFHP